MTDKHLLGGEHVESVSFPEIQDPQASGSGFTYKVWNITQEQLRQLRLPTAEEIQAIREAAHQEGQEAGYQSGYEKGEKAGYASGAQKIQQEVQRLNAILGQLAQPLAQQEAKISALFVELLTMALQALIKHELAHGDSSIRAVVDEALEKIQYASGPVRLKLNPLDVALYQAGSEDMSLRDAVHVIADASIDVGGCVVETSACEVDARLESRLAHVLDAFSEMSASDISAATDDAKPEAGA